MIRLIGVLGMKGCGKDTLAQFLVERLGFVRVSFADALYEEVAQAYGVSVAFLRKRETKETPTDELALINCADQRFVTVALRTLRKTLRASFDEKSELWAPRSPRWVMQCWGTEYRRESEFGRDNYWIDQIAKLISANDKTRYVIADVRFMNEVSMVRDFDGALIRVRRPALEQKEAEARARGMGTALHTSETEVASLPVDLEVINVEGRPDSVLERLDELLPELARVA